MNSILKNDSLVIEIKARGAELISAKDIIDGYQYIWTGDAKYWGKHAPILFPIVGALEKDTYVTDGETYQMPKHGIGRISDFLLVEESDDTLTYLFESNEENKKMYPFDYKLFIRYTLAGRTLNVDYKVMNVGDKPMYFSIGAHPAFNCPVSEEVRLEDYYVAFDQEETLDRYPIDMDTGMIDRENAYPYLKDERIININDGVFKEDALVFENTKSDRVSVRNRVNKKAVEVTFRGFPYLGIWAVPGAPFVCIEPWFGIADFIGKSRKLEEKAGIMTLKAHETFMCRHSMKFI